MCSRQTSVRRFVFSGDKEGPKEYYPQDSRHSSAFLIVPGRKMFLSKVKPQCSSMDTSVIQTGRTWSDVHICICEQQPQRQTPSQSNHDTPHRTKSVRKRYSEKHTFAMHASIASSRSSPMHHGCLYLAALLEQRNKRLAACAPHKRQTVI